MPAGHGVRKASSAIVRPSRSSHVIRTQFSFPVEDRQLLGVLQDRGLRQGLRITKNQIVRAGLRVLDAMTPGAFGEVVEQSKPMKPGRKPSSWSTFRTPVPRSYRSASAGKSALRGSWPGSPAGRRRKIEGSAKLTTELTPPIAPWEALRTAAAALRRKLTRLTLEEAAHERTGQITHRLLITSRHPHRGQLPGSVKPCQAHCVAAIRLHPIPRP